MYTSYIYIIYVYIDNIDKDITHTHTHTHTQVQCSCGKRGRAWRRSIRPGRLRRMCIVRPSFCSPRILKCWSNTARCSPKRVVRTLLYIYAYVYIYIVYIYIQRPHHKVHTYYICYICIIFLRTLYCIIMQQYGTNTCRLIP